MEKKLSIVIPVCNEEVTILDVLHGIKKELSGKIEYEILVIDDGSTDDTFNKLKDSDIVLITHKKRRGYGAAIKTGIKKAQHDYVCTMDSDGQHHPKDIVKLFEYAGEYDLVIGKRPGIKTTLLRFPGRWLVTALTFILLHKRIPDLNSGMRIFKRKIILSYLNICSDGFSFSTTSTISFMGDNREVAFIPISLKARKSGESHVNLYTGLRTLLLVFQIITVFRPIRIFFPISLLFGLLGGISLTLDLMNQNITDASLLLLISAIIFFFFALISDQLARLRRELIKE